MTALSKMIRARIGKALVELIDEVLESEIEKPRKFKLKLEIEGTADLDFPEE